MADIRFARTDETHLYYEIEDWIDNISSSSQTAIKMNFNNPAATDNTNPNRVFDVSNGFQGVWHINESVTDKSVSDVHADAT